MLTAAAALLQGALVQWLDGAADRRGAEAGWGKNFAAECRGVVAVMPLLKEELGATGRNGSSRRCGEFHGLYSSWDCKD